MTATQASLTGMQIRALLDEIESPEPTAAAPLQRIRDAAALIERAEALLAEAVADARAVPAEGRRAVVREKVVSLEKQKPADKSNGRYGWDVIGYALGVSPQRAHKKFVG